MRSDFTGNGNSSIFVWFMLFVLCIALVQCKSTSKEGADLEAGFLNPPESAKPRVWWHWMNGNITKEGIQADLEWMHRTGIGGFQNFDAALMTPQVVEKRLVYMTPEWKDAFLFTTKMADSLGLEMAIAGSPGWSESGGPWVKPEQAMKKLVWSEIRIEGGKAFSGKLPHPPTTTGTFQNIPLRNDGEGGQHIEFYKDALVLAFRVPETDIPLSDLNPKVTSSGGRFNVALLTDGDLNNSAYLPPAKVGEKAWVQYEFSSPQTMQALTIMGGGYAGMWGRGADPDTRALEASDDGKKFRKVTDIPISGIEEKTLTFDPVTAKYFRFTFITVEQSAMNFFGFDIGAGGVKGTNIAELVLHSVPRVNRFQEKAAFSTATDLYTAHTRTVKEDEVTKTGDVMDLTDKMQPDGTLDWTPAEGKWIIIRFGYTLTGHQNGPASAEATGLEVDKLSAEHVKAYFNNYLDQYKDATGGLMGAKGLQYVITDSWEAGVQNWTDNMPTDFKSRRGYDMLPWLPALTGHIVESAEASDKFLWDFRKTIGDLTTENHYDLLTDILKERGMARYTESHEGGRAFIGDGMEVKRNAAIPMSATWTPGLEPGAEVSTGYKADLRESASVAHIYGQNLVAAESMTAIGTAWAWSPETLKPTADMEMANGLNRFVIHTSVHQPVNDKIPGLGLGPFGQWFTRHETWAEQAGPWITYLARSSYMLQQGKFVADILYFYGEDNNITALFGEKLPAIPEGYNYDFVNADALVHVLGVEKGKLTTPSGMRYNLLALDANSQHMSLPVLRKIRDLVKAGAVVVGSKPSGTPSLSDDQAEFQAIADELWASEKGENTVGKGKVYGGLTIAEVLAALKIAPDFIYTKPQPDTRVLFVHRKLNNADFYWVNNRNHKVENLDATFRVKGRAAEIWHPETGRIEPASYEIVGEMTKVKLRLEPDDAVFVVFRKKAEKESIGIPRPDEKKLIEVKDPWNLSFQADRGAPAQISLTELAAWNENTDPGVKYFSGTGSYVTSIQAPAEWFQSGSQLWLDLGSVKNLAEVIINGKSLGIVWKTPFRVNATDALQEGDNKIEIRVTNLWVNRLIGDQQPGVKTKITYTTMPFYRADSPLMPSGLLGPVEVVRVEEK
ncbi:MAG: glycoside hydrolase family 2 [Bacteroidales bacterium]|nr:glycoside hydrolase family 2 [Bacteroidales bacterium]